MVNWEQFVRNLCARSRKASALLVSIKWRRNEKPVTRYHRSLKSLVWVSEIPGMRQLIVDEPLLIMDAQKSLVSFFQLLDARPDR